jgi:hypothetical protein
VTAEISLADLIDRGEHDDHLHAPAGLGPSGALEWLGLAVGELPYLMSSARTVDDLKWRSRAPNAAQAQVALIDAFGQQLASSVALLHRALAAHVEHHPALGDVATVLADVDFLSSALVERSAPQSRRADVLVGAYVTAVAGAVQASGRPGAEEVVSDSLARALATLLGHARLNGLHREGIMTRQPA